MPDIASTTNPVVIPLAAVALLIAAARRRRGPRRRHRPRRAGGRPGRAQPRRSGLHDAPGRRAGLPFARQPATSGHPPGKIIPDQAVVHLPGPGDMRGRGAARGNVR